MKINEVFDALRFGELSQLSLATADDGDIPESKYPMLLSHIQLGLTALHKRFPLREGRVTLTLQPGQAEYKLTADYALTNRYARMPVKYLDDTAEPFRDTMLKLERIILDSGRDLPLNQEGNQWSAFTPRLNFLRLPDELVAQGSDIPDWLKTEKLVLVFRDNHPKIDVEDFDIEDSTIDLPDSHLEPLLYYVAARVHNPIGTVGPSNEGQVGMSWSARYEAACKELEGTNLRVDRVADNTRLERNGWV